MKMIWIYLLFLEEEIDKKTPANKRGVQSIDKISKLTPTSTSGSFFDFSTTVNDSFLKIVII